MGISRRKNRKNPFRLKGLVEGIIVLIMATLLTLSFNFVITQFMLPAESVQDSQKEIGLIKDLIGAVISAVSAGFVVYQLNSGEKESKRHVEVEKSEFILDYNKSFIENTTMTEIERYLECRLTHVEKSTVFDLNNQRQEMVNYLVYLEGFASCVLSGVLDFDDIDDLFAYRFFLAMNHVEVQAMDLLPYAEYYRGCYQLYDKWMDYRMTSSKYSDSDYELPLYATSLCNHYGYEKYACPDIKVIEKENKEKTVFSASMPASCKVANLFGIKHNVKLSFDAAKEADEKKVSVKKGIFTSGKSLQYKKLLRMLLKKAIYEKYITMIKCDQKEISDLFAELLKTKNFLYKECYSENLKCRQLNKDIVMRRKSLREIAELIRIGKKEEACEIDIIPSTDELLNLLMSGTDKYFKLDNLIVCEANETILGIILWNANQHGEKIITSIDPNAIGPENELNYKIEHILTKEFEKQKNS